MVATFQRIGAAALSTARQLAADQAGQPFASIAERYDLLNSYYHNEMYDLTFGVSGLAKARAGLYRNIRPIRNPMRRAVDSYPDRVYPGVMTSDGLPLPDGTPCCIPFATDTEENARLAMTQIMAWANWERERWPVIRSLAIYGDAFGEIEVDFERGVVYPKFHHPGRVVDIEWNGSGDVVMYRLEIPMTDENGRAYRWGKIVDKTSTTFLRDDKPFADGETPAVIENDYGFVPAAWCQFRNIGGQHGASLLDGVRAKIDEVNSTISPINDFIQKFVSQGVIIAAKGGRQGFEAAMASKTTGGATADRENPQGGRQELGYLFVPEGTEFFKPLDNLGLADADPHVERLCKEIEADLPEATIDERIQQMSTPPSGRALRMMFGSAATRYQEAAGNADHMIVKLMQMGTSVMAHEVEIRRFGRVSDLTDDQRKFLGFTIDSYKKGFLSTSLMPRLLFPDTQLDKVQLATAIESLRTPTGMRIVGLNDEEIAALLEEQQTSAVGTSDLLGRAFSGGRV